VVDNSGVTINTGVSYSGKTALSAAVQKDSGSANNWWFGFQHSSGAITPPGTHLTMVLAASTPVSASIYFNGGYVQTAALTTSWQTFTFTVSSMLPPSITTIGNTAWLILSNPSTTSGDTFYVASVEFS